MSVPLPKAPSPLAPPNSRTPPPLGTLPLRKSYPVQEILPSHPSLNTPYPHPLFRVPLPPHTSSKAAPTSHNPPGAGDTSEIYL